MKDNLTEEKITSEMIYDGSVVHLYKDSVRLPDGNTAVRELIRHVGAVCIIPLTDRGTVIVEKQYRYPTGKVLIEIPAGKLEDKNEDRLLAAKRELREETGYTAGCWRDLGAFYPAPAYSDEYIQMYLASDLQKGEQDLDPDEFLTISEEPLSFLLDEVMSGNIEDEKTQLGILKAALIAGTASSSADDPSYSAGALEGACWEEDDDDDFEIPDGDEYDD